MLLKGFNLGGWLMMEGYILGGPNIAFRVFRKKFSRLYGKKELDNFLLSFRRNFIREEDIKRIYEKNGVLGLSYWVARDKISKQVIGLTGIYTEEDGETCWLGWFCIDEAYRGKNFGKKLLEFSIQQARKMEKKYLHIHTYNASRFKKAITLYERMFFYRYAIEGKNLYYKLSLQGRNYHTKLLELFTKDELEKLVDESMLDGKNIDVIFISGDTIVAEIFVDYRENTAKIAVLEDSGLGYNKILPKDEFLKIYNESKENPPQILEVDRKQKIY